MPDVTVKLDRLIPARDVVIPYVWVRGSKVESIESAFNESPGVKAIRLIDLLYVPEDTRATPEDVGLVRSPASSTRTRLPAR